MEIILATLTLLAIITLIVLVGTRGKPLTLIYQFRAVAAEISAHKLQLVIVAMLVVFLAGFVYYFYILPDVGAGPLQPIPFSHRLHAGHKAIDCRFCHPYADRSIDPGLPPVEKCLYCHNHIIAKHPQILKEHNYFTTETPTPWKKVFYVPEHVLFNHQRHIKRKVECVSCHGDLTQVDRLKQHEFKMGFCIACHKKENANLGCWLSCHN